MNLKTIFPLLVFLACNTLFSQTIVRVNPTQSGGPSPALYQPGVFSNPRNTEGDAVWNSLNTTYNCLRTNHIEWYIGSSTSMSNYFTQLNYTQSFLQDKYQKTNQLAVLIAKMPKWLSSSSDTTVGPDAGWRKYMTRPPSSYVLWDSLIRGTVAKLKSWGISPYYEVWNEPDLGYWTGTPEELIELYKHTAIAVKQADPNAKVGGFGMNGWANSSNFSFTMPSDFGFFPDTLADSTSLLAQLIDSAAVWGNTVPLDFISWHWFSIYANEIPMAANYFRNKIAGYGMNPIPFLITEWNAVSSSREEPFHGPTVLRQYKKMCEAGVAGHAVSVFQDWNYDANEFIKDYGVVSYGGLMKPAFKSMLLLDYLQKGADTLHVNVTDPIVSFASLKSDTVKILLSNFVYWPFYAAWEELLYNHPFNKLDLIAAGYTTTGKIDSTFKGLLAPTGPAALISAFNKAKAVYAYSVTTFSSNKNISMRIAGQTGLKNGRMTVIDSTHNNIIYQYDSLRALGYTSPQTVAALFPAQAFTFSNIQLTDSIFNFSMQPNATVFLEFYNISTVTSAAENTQDNFMSAYPNPFTRFTIIKIKDGTDHQNTELSIYDVFGKEVKRINSISSEEIIIDGSNLSKGVYMYMLRNGEEVIGRGKLVKD